VQEEDYFNILFLDWICKVRGALEIEEEEEEEVWDTNQ